MATKFVPMTNTRKPAVAAQGAPTKARIMVTLDNGSVERQVKCAGGTIVTAAAGLGETLERLSTCDGLVVTGGGDVNPKLYDTERHPQTQWPSPERDMRELVLLGAARDLGIPVLGICRGLQIITVEAGGALYQHVPDRVKHSNHDCSMMPVTTVRGSILNRTMGDHPNVLHLHHQSLRRTPDGFQVSARHADGTVEAIESTDGRVVGVQFHPESVLTSFTGEDLGARLFVAFLRSAKRYKRRSRRDGGVLKTQPLSTYLARWPIAQDAWQNDYTSQSWKKPYIWNDDDSDYEWSKKVTDKRPTGSATIVKTEMGPRLKIDDMEVVEDLSGELLPAAWCGNCNIPFDLRNDYLDHMEYFHTVEM